VIYDTMTVFENLAFPLRNRGVEEARIRVRVAEVAEMLELSADLPKRARRLAADAKQKISLGRGLVRDDVAAILFDEPLTVIDPNLKWQLRRKLKEIHERFKLTLVYVTHDQNEALTFADRVVVMYEGQIVQLGTPQELFEAPSHTFVGYFIGSPGMNVLPCAVEPGAAVIGGQRIPVDGAVAARAEQAGGVLELGIRPEFLRISGEAAEGAVPVAVTRLEDLGNFKIATLELAGRILKARLPEDSAPLGERGFASFPPEWTKLYADGRLIG